MARITVDDALEVVHDRFALVMLTTQRAKQIMKGSKPLVDSDNRPVVVALREVAAGTVSIGLPAREEDES